MFFFLRALQYSLRWKEMQHGGILLNPLKEPKFSEKSIEQLLIQYIHTGLWMKSPKET